MSSPLKRSAPDDGPQLGPRSSHPQITNSASCGDPRCNVRACVNGPFTTLYFYPPFSKAEIVAESDKASRTVNPVVWNVYCPDNFVALRQHRHLMHMMHADATTDTDFTFYLYMPFDKTWDIINPFRDIVQVRSPGFLIIKHRDLQDRNCKGLDRLKKVLGSTVKSVSYK